MTECQWPFIVYGILSVLCLLSGSAGHIMGRCECPEVMVLDQFHSSFQNETCCLNFTGSSFTDISWETLGSLANLEILDLSLCNLTHIDKTGSFSSLRKLYLGQNWLRSVPSNFLANAYHLEFLDLGENMLGEIPVDFLQNSKNLRVLILGGNQLRFLPASIFKPSLRQLDLKDNPWNCDCSFIEELQKIPKSNSTNFETITGNITCTSPPKFAHKSAWSLLATDICSPSKSLSALFILLPLLLLLVVLLCWCCGKKGKDNQSPSLRTSSKEVHLDRNGRWVQEKTGFAEKAQEDTTQKNQLMLRPSSALLGSTRDIYEEVEVKLGSVDSLGPPPSASSAEGIIGKEKKEEEDKQQDLETVSVTEVMKDSADREKAYMTQSTKYYSLVPGLEMEDSDHGEYESVDLS
ncbi:toll-like receptor 3 [Hoplias malabaricus]|uniref:toll-like receptor 3 n=1 Tax=Hoplias malabaricus TaxID=27720 RepID=UPI003461BB19